MNKKISVIVPAYNVEKYLRRCLDSLVYQTYPHLEILVIDDGSTDGTRGIIEEYVSRFAGKVFLYAQENAGQAAARNNGISYATGDYIGFVDADDFVSPRMYEYLVQEAEEKDCDLVTCGYYGCNDETGEIQVYQAGCRGEFDQSIFENPEILRLNAPYPWNKLYRKELLENAGFAFPEGIIFEDLAAVFPLFLSAKKVGRVHEKLYYYIKGRKGGTMSTFDQRHMQILDALKIVDEKFIEKGAFEKFQEILLFFHIRHIQARFDEMEKYGDFSFEKEFRERSETLLDAYFPGWKESKAYQERKKNEEAEEETDEETDEKTIEEMPEKEENINKPAPKKIRKAQVFEEIMAEKPVQKGLVLIESYHGNDCIETGYYMAKALSASDSYEVCVVAADAAKQKQFEEKLGQAVSAIEITSPEYIEKLATAEIVMNNQAFPGYYRKRKGQKFVFMDFLPAYYGEGRFASYSAKNMQGIQFSLAQADVILFSKEKEEIFGKCLEAYNMRELCEKKGLFVSLKDLPFPSMREEEETVFVTAYLPAPKAFPGLKDSKNFLFLSELKKQLLYLDANLRDNEKILVHYPRTIRRRLVDEGWKHICFSASIQEKRGADPYEVLAGCDAAVGEAGREMTAMESFGKPVCHYAAFDCERDWTQGKTEPWKKEQWEQKATLDEVLEWIHEQAEKASKKPNPAVDTTEWNEKLQSFVAGISRKKNGHIKREWFYAPSIQNFQEFQKWLPQIQGKEDTTLYVFEKEAVCDGLTDWIREYCPKLNFVVILRSLVVGKKESRKIKWKLTTKDKLREARDRERYLGR